MLAGYGGASGPRRYVTSRRAGGVERAAQLGRLIFFQRTNTISGNTAAAVKE